MQSLLTRLLLGGGGGFSPAALFSSGAEGVWYDPSDTSTLFQDPAGTTPVTAVEQPVGLMLDKSKGLVLGSELVTTLPTPIIQNASGSVGVWTAGTQTISSTTITAIDSYPRYLFTIAGAAIGRSYLVTINATGNNIDRVKNPSFGGSGPIATFATGSISFIATNITSTTLQIITDSRVVYSASLTVSVRELPGNHAISYNSTTARPTLSARVNLLTYSEDFATTWLNSRTAVTVNTTAAPDGSITADTIAEDNQTGATGRSQTVSTVAGVSYTFSCFLKNIDRRYVQLTVYASASANYISAAFDLVAQTSTTAANGTGYSVTSASVVDVGNGWFRCSITGVVGTTPAVAAAVSPRPDATAGGVPNYAGTTLAFYAWGADLRPANIGSAVPSYQRIAAATDYDTNGFPKYLRFDGSDDGMSTPANLNLTSTDKVTVFSGLRKLSDAAVGVIAELSADRNTNNGAWTMGYGSAASDYGFSSKGTISTTAASASSFSPPITNVLTGTGDISGDSAILRINGAQAASSTADQGTGNYGSYPLYIGSRNNGSNWLNGYLYGLTVVGAQLTTPQIESMESWTAGKTGITL